MRLRLSAGRFQVLETVQTVSGWRFQAAGNAFPVTRKQLTLFPAVVNGQHYCKCTFLVGSLVLVGIYSI